MRTTERFAHGSLFRTLGTELLPSDKSLGQSRTVPAGRSGDSNAKRAREKLSLPTHGARLQSLADFPDNSVL